METSCAVQLPVPWSDQERSDADSTLNTHEFSIELPFSHPLNFGKRISMQPSCAFYLPFVRSAHLDWSGEACTLSHFKTSFKVSLRHQKDHFAIPLKATSCQPIRIQKLCSCKTTLYPENVKLTRGVSFRDF